MKQKLNGLSVIRALACIGVLLAHTGFLYMDSVGKCCVSLFLILSGFVMTYSYYGTGRISKPSISGNIKFSFHKIKGLYPLYLVTMCAMAVFLMVGEDKFQASHLAALVGTNLLIIQEWLPIEGSSINFVSWYFCTVTCAYFVFPWVLRRMETNYSKRKALAYILVFYGAQVLAGIVGRMIPTPAYVSGGWWRSDFTVWFVFNLPPIRTIDFLIGCNLGYCFLHRKKKGEANSERMFTAAEFGGGVLVLLTIVLYARVMPVESDQNPMAHPELWWIYTLLFTGGSCILIYLFALNKGQISKFLSNRYLFRLSEISPYLFLIHSVVFRYFTTLVALLFRKAAWLDAAKPWLLLIIGIPLSVLCAEIWSAGKARRRMHTKFKS